MRFRVYQVKRNLDYAHFYPTPEGPRGPFNGYIFSGKKIGSDWVPPQVYRLYPMRERWDIAVYITPSALVITHKAAESLNGFIHNSGVELLPFDAEGEKVYVINILEMPNCLNEQASQLLPGSQVTIAKYEFYPLRSRARSSSFPAGPETSSSLKMTRGRIGVLRRPPNGLICEVSGTN
jgi:hypothetical protein